MAATLLLLLIQIFFFFCPLPTALQQPRPTQAHQRELNATRRKLGYLSCATGNPIDDCWRCTEQNSRHTLAKCGVGFGKHAMGGHGSRYYTVTDNSDNPTNPRPGSLRYGAIQKEPLWIVFGHSMTIRLAQELMVNSHKTIDGRGAEVVVTGNSGVTLQFVTNIIITSIEIKGMVPAGNAMVCDSPDHCGWRTKSDGDGIGLFGASDIWIDHCTLSNCADGLIDVIEGSTRVSITNSYFHDHDKVMLLGASDSYAPDDNMRVSIAFNHFGDNLTERMPRGRRGLAHVVNNYYKGWNMYAVGGGENFEILSQGNVYAASKYPEVTHRQDNSRMNWNSHGDEFLNGAFFSQMGSTIVGMTSTLSAKSSTQVQYLTANAGVWKWNS